MSDRDPFDSSPADAAEAARAAPAPVSLGAIARWRATFPSRLALAAADTWRRLGQEGRLLAGAAPPVLAMPASFAGALATALALEEAAPGPAGRLELLTTHYLQTMPAMRVEQLATSAPPAPAIFHTPLDWDRLPCLRGAVERLFALLAEAQVAPAEVFGVPTAAAFLSSAGTAAGLYRRTYYGDFMPLLYAYPADLGEMGRALEQGAPCDAVIDHYLAAPLAHELTHAAPGRAALSPPYLDECVASYLGRRVLGEMVFPSPLPGAPRTLYAAPWLCQVGQALARAAGLRAVVRAHAGATSWAEALPPGLSRAATRLGWDEYARHRDPHFLSSNLRPDPWIKLFFLAAGGESIEGRSLEDLAALPWSEVPAGEEQPLDEEILRDALASVCLRNTLSRGTFHVERHAPAGPVRIDLAACRVSAPPAPDGPDRAPLSYLFPPATARRLRDRGIAGYTAEIDTLDGTRDLADLDDLIQAVRDGAPSRRGAGHRLHRHLL